MPPTPLLVLALRPPAPAAPALLPTLGTPAPLTPAMAPTSPRRNKNDAWAGVMLDIGLVARAGTMEENTPEGLELVTGPAEEREKERRGRGTAESPRTKDPPALPLADPGTGTTAAEVAGLVRDRPRLGRVPGARGDTVLGAAADATEKGSRTRGDRMAVTGRA